MLVLSRKKNESIVIDDDITIVVVEIRAIKCGWALKPPRKFPSIDRKCLRPSSGISRMAKRTLRMRLLPAKFELVSTTGLDSRLTCAPHSAERALALLWWLPGTPLDLFLQAGLQNPTDQRPRRLAV